MKNPEKESKQICLFISKKKKKKKKMENVITKRQLQPKFVLCVLV